MTDNPKINATVFIVIVVVCAIIVSNLIRKIFDIFIKRFSKKINTDPTNFAFLKNSIGFVTYLIAALFLSYKLPSFKQFTTFLFAGAGILTVSVGFASQKAFSNIISGIFILIFRPFKIGDVIEFTTGNYIGIVEDITLRHTIIRDYQNKRIVIPNSSISEATIINSSIEDQKIRKHIIFSISYTSNIDEAIKIITEEALNHPLIIDNRTDEEKMNNDKIVQVRVIGLKDFSVDLKAYIWAENNSDAFLINCDLLKSVKERFEKSNIEIPYPYRNVVIKNKEEVKNG